MRTSINLSEISRRQLVEIGGQQSETIRRSIAVLWTLEVLKLGPAGGFNTNAIKDAADFACGPIDPADPHGTQRR
jgi:hypothetical protein